MLKTTLWQKDVQSIAQMPWPWRTQDEDSLLVWLHVMPWEILSCHDYSKQSQVSKNIPGCADCWTD